MKKLSTTEYRQRLNTSGKNTQGTAADKPNRMNILPTNDARVTLAPLKFDSRGGGELVEE